MFDLEFFQNDELINKNTGLEEDLVFKTDDLIYNHKDKLLMRSTAEYDFNIDFNKGILSINLNDMNYNGDVSLYHFDILDNEDQIEIVYQIDSNEPINKIVITRRKNER